MKRDLSNRNGNVREIASALRILLYFAVMISISHKTKQFLVLIIKLLIVSGAFYFIYNQLANNDKLNWEQFIILFKKNQSVF